MAPCENEFDIPALGNSLFGLKEFLHTCFLISIHLINERGTLCRSPEVSLGIALSSLVIILWTLAVLASLVFCFGLLSYVSLTQNYDGLYIFLCMHFPGMNYSLGWLYYCSNGFLVYC